MTSDIDPQQEQERLDDVGARIEDGKRDLAELEGRDDERRFSDDGTEGPIDDAIAPPG